MTTVQTPEEIREEWNEAFEPEVPEMLKGVEVKNADGSYSCITCGIKRDAIADWWLEKLQSREEWLKGEIEGLRDMFEAKVNREPYNIALDDVLSLINHPKEI